MFTFYEWLEKKKDIVLEASRMGQMTYEELPDIAPESGQIVVFMDKPKVSITNNDIYYVMQKDNNSITLIPKAAVDQTNPNVGNQMQIPRAMWKDFTLVNHLLTRKEKIERFSNKPVWVIGVSKNKWISNRETEIRKQSRMSPGVHQQADIDPIKLAQVRKQFTSDVSEEPDVSATRNWLRNTPI